MTFSAVSTYCDYARSPYPVIFGSIAARLGAMTQRALDEDDVKKLASHRLFTGLSIEMQSAIWDRCSKRGLAKGEAILSEGASNSTLFVVLSGSVAVTLPERSGAISRVSRVDLARLGAGAIFGEYSMFDGKSVSAAVAAGGPTTLACLARRDLDLVLGDDAAASRLFYGNLVLLLIERLREKNHELDVLTLG
jgi:CRP-like cAMP-binding protein